MALLATLSCNPAPKECVDDETFFRESVQKEVLSDICMSCHTSSGAARNTDLILVSSVFPNYLETNQAAMANIAGLERDGESLLLLKPRGDDNHGGGSVLATKSDEYRILEEYLERLEAPVQCENKGNTELPTDIGLTLASPTVTLRKASTLLVGRLPNASETEAVWNHGESGLEDALDDMMEEEAFISTMQEMWNDVLLTDRYKDCCDGIGLVDYDRYPNLYWYGATTDGTQYNLNKTYLNQAVAREPLEIIARVIREDRPLTEILTADWTMVNAYTAMAYDVKDTEWPNPYDPSTRVYQPTQLEGIPHAGILTTTAYLNRFPTTETNRNRHRSWMFFNTFLATDILQLAERPVDPTVSDIHNPTQNDPQCNICHAVMEPIAGLFQNWDEEGAMNPLEDGWYPEMSIPGFDGEALPSSEKGHALRWLGERTAQDPRFPLAMTRLVFRGITGLPLLDYADLSGDPVQEEASLQQQAFIEQVSQEFVEADYNFKVLVKAIVLSHYFRASGYDGASEATLLLAGTAHLLTNEQLNRRIESVLGFPWRTQYNHSDHLLDRYSMLYGGIDSDSVVQRLSEPNGIIANIGLRLSTEMACVAVPFDFVLEAEQRRLFPFVELGFQPLTSDGLTVPDAEAHIRKNIRYLHLRVTGEDLEVNDPEVDAIYALWYDTWWEGRQRVAQNLESDLLPSECRATREYWSNESLPSDRRIKYDTDYTLRAWMAVLTYELSDYRFFYE